MDLSFLASSDELGRDNFHSKPRDPVNYLIMHHKRESPICENFILGPYERVDKYVNKYTEHYEKRFKEGLELFNNQKRVTTSYFDFSSYNIIKIEDGYLL